MPYEQHHMRLIELIDNLIKLFKTDPDYHFFHLDGQTIVLDDYLQVRPENRSIIKQLTSSGKLQVGPFYILQDDFLISNESNARDMLIGHREAQKWTNHMAKVGYFPDTFGNMGQTPQLLRQAGLDNAMFGRGVKPTGFANATSSSDDFSSKFSEMNWVGPDGSKVLGILFANWYDNGKEIPTEKVAAKAFWDKKLASTGRYASTDDLLFLNGSDHEPVQMDLSKAIRVANELYPDIEFIHANYNMYLDQLRKDLPKNLDQVTGELTSQETNGWTTLANTASNRVPIKQRNTEVSVELEKVAEPLATLANVQLGKPYPHDQLTYAWKTLLQNHPHDSICACSVDEVSQEMQTRYMKSEQVAKYVAKESLDELSQNINTNEMAHEQGAHPFVVFNTATSEKTDTTIVEVPLEQVVFNPNKDDPKAIFDELKQKPVIHYQVKDADGKIVPSTVLDVNVKFGFRLPKDQFRQAIIKRVARIRVYLAKMKPLSWMTLRLVPQAKTSDAHLTKKNEREIENDYLKVTVEQDGRLTVLDKISGHTYHHLMQFEDTGDVGNEYVYRASADPVYVSSNFKNDVTSLVNNDYQQSLALTIHLELPESMNEQLAYEQQAHIDYRKRTAKRVKQTQSLDLKIELVLLKDSPRLQINLNYDNQVKDHRLRVLFPTDLNVKNHYADSIFEVVKRPNQVSTKWKNPENPQHTHAFVNVHDKTRGLTVSNYGLNEYEVARDGGQIAMTVLRCIGEMGDWGYFPTPGAQCQGPQTTKIGLEFHGATEQGRLETFHHAFASQVPFSTVFPEWQNGKLEMNATWMKVATGAVKTTAVKVQEDGEGVVTRSYNLTDKAVQMDNDLANYQAFASDLLENAKSKEPERLTLQPYEIHTTLWKEQSKK